MALDPVSIGMTLLGGLLGGQSSSSNQSSTRSPYAPAEPWLKSNIAEGQKLQDYYRQNPFNAQQQTGYNNLFGDIDHFRNQVAPGMMGFANSMMGSNYQRARGQVGSAGYGPASPAAAPAAQPGPFSLAPGGSFGKVDFNASNPYKNGSITPPAPTAAAIGPNTVMPEGRRGGGYASTSTPDYATAYTLAEMTENPTLMGYVADGILNSSNIAAREADAMPSTTEGLAQGYDGPGSNRAASRFSDPGSSNSGSARAGGGDGGGGARASGQQGATGGGYMAKGGPVTPNDVKGPNPAGPDDGYTALDIGEYVIKKSAVNKYGQGVFDAINQGKLPAKALRGLL